MLPSPIPPITLKNSIELADVLSKAGATIQELNYVRQNIEILKGGGLAHIAKPARVRVFSCTSDSSMDILPVSTKLIYYIPSINFLLF